MAKAPKSEFVCTECGAVEAKWLGRCPSCGSSGTLQEREPQSTQPTRGLGGLGAGEGAVPLHSISNLSTKRLHTGNAEFDRAMGGGLAPGSLVLLGGDPGVGKSTLTLQTLATLAAAGVRTLYVSGEESAVQVRLRAERLQVGGSDMLLYCETSLRRILDEARRIQPQVLVVDSVQTIWRDDLPGTPGSLNQLRECTMELMVHAKTSGCVTLLVGHVTKEGQIAGPKVLEHMVDTVAYFEGDRNHQYRVLRTIKNRFGATDEIGVFEMTSRGLEAVENPSRVFLLEAAQRAPGSVVSCTVEGSRAMMFEVQALVNQGTYAVPQRVAAGVEQKRLTILLALLDKFGGVHVGASDVFVSIAGGLRVDDPGTDLALAMAVAGNHLNLPTTPHAVVIGELGLSGEVRPVGQLELRIKEAHRLGFKDMLLPPGGKLPALPDCRIHRVSRLEEAIRWLQENA